MVMDPKEAVAELTSLVGKREARDILERFKVNESTAEKLVGGRYKSEVGFLLLQKIYKALEAAKSKRSA
jgi:hypothetical protein